MNENLPAQRSTFDAEIVALTEKLRPAEDHAIARVIAGLLDFGFLAPSSIPPKSFNDKYRYALDGISETGLKTMAAKLVRGEYPDHVGKFLPLPTEMAVLARAEDRVMREDRTRLRIKQESASLQPEEKRSPEQQERIREIVANARRVTTVMRGKAPELPMDGEKAAYVKQIMAIRDRGGITAEEETQRRKVAADIERYERESGNVE